MVWKWCQADSGRPLGHAVRATVTATFAFPKICQLMYPGADLCGQLEVIDIGIPAKDIARLETILNEKKAKAPQAA